MRADDRGQLENTAELILKPKHFTVEVSDFPDALPLQDAQCGCSVDMESDSQINAEAVREANRSDSLARCLHYCYELRLRRALRYRALALAIRRKHGAPP